MKSKFLLIQGLFIAAFCGVTSCSTGSTNFTAPNKSNVVKVDCSDITQFKNFDCIVPNQNFDIMNSAQKTAQIDKSIAQVNNGAHVVTIATTPDPSRTVPKAFAGVVDLLNHNTPPNEPSPPIICHYSQKQQNIFTSWQTKYPQLKSVATTCQTAMIDKLRTSESISQLIGPINNPYGVRDDILEQIVKMVPESNPQMLQAAIKSAYYNNLALYSSSKDDKLKNVNLFGNALFCLMILDKSTTNKDEKNITQMISSKFRDNESRSNYIHDVETKVFAWQAISSTDNNFAQNCHNGEY